MVSIVINCDTRAGFTADSTETQGMFNGCVSEDFIIDGVLNKIKFFDGFEKEVIVFIDKHEELPQKTLEHLRKIADCVVIRNHTSEPLFNDNNYFSALCLARGEYIAHFDQDVAAFTSDAAHIHEMISMLDVFDYVSYPSWWSPLPITDHSFDHVWVSTRFFMCRRGVLNLGEIRRCIDDYDYWCERYPVNRKCHWMEHILGSISKHVGNGVFYPEINYDKMMIFAWGKYERFILQRLNHQSYDEVKSWVLSKGGIVYPNDVNI